jgi:pseudaminic acid biosynthesis-associated methylase
MEGKQPTKQLTAWTTEFGKEYTDRNPIAIEEMDRELGEYYGIGLKSHLFRQFLPVERLSSGKVLEVGSNIGMQLKILQTVNPALALFGLEPMEYALEKGRALNPDINFTQGTAFSIPFEDNTFDLVMTNGVLIHIHPTDLPKALSEIHRVSRRYIMVHEYYAATPTEVKYHGKTDLLWKTDFVHLYTSSFQDLRPVEMRYLNYPDPVTKAPLVDQVALLEKTPASGGK